MNIIRANHMATVLNHIIIYVVGNKVPDSHAEEYALHFCEVGDNTL